MQLIKKEGITLAYKDVNPGSPPMLFVHGCGCDHTHFAPQEPVGFTKWSSVVARAFNPQVSGPSRQAPKVPLRGAIH
jgi:pimeloyl-ACP methyl ester carboxylesterase